MTSFNERIVPRTARSESVLMALLLIGAIIPAALVLSSGASVALNSVEVNIQTAKDLPYQYTLTAYNTSGYQVANFYGNYPEAGFGLPTGTYLITASAYYQQYNVCYLCPLEAGANASASSVAIPIRYFPPASEYGFSVVKVTGPTQMTLDTKNSTDFALVKTPVHVAFFNGTAAAGASVSAYVVGMEYGYGQSWVSYGQTGPDGNVTLVMPAAPVEVNAYLSVPVQLPKGVGTVPVDVGGQKVNVTVYWQPAEVQLSGQALILPPQTGADITLKVQQYSFPVPYPVYSGSGSVQGVTTVTVTSTSGPSQQGAASAEPGRIAPFAPTASQLSTPAQAATTPASDPLVVLPLALGAGAVAAVALAAMILSKRKQPVQGARP